MSNILYNPPFVVPVNVDPVMERYSPLFTGYAIAALQEIPNDYRGPGRQLYLKIMESNERLFAEMVQTLASASQYVLESNDASPDQTEKAIQSIVQTVVDGYYGLAIDTHARDFEQSGAISEQQYNDRGVVIKKLQNLMAEMESFYRGGNQPRGRGSMTSGTGWGGNAQNRSSFTGSGAGGRRNDDMRRDADSVFVSDGRAPAKRDDDNFSSGGRVQRKVIKEPEVVQYKPNVWEGRQFLPMHSGTTGYPLTLNPRRPWDWVVARDDGLMLKPAVLSDWKLTNKEGFTVPWYDPQTSVLMHFKDATGKIWAQPFQRENDMNYFDHEQDPELRQMAKEEAMARDGKMPAAFQMVESIRPQPGKPLAELGPVEGDELATEVLSSPDDFELANNIKAVYDRHMLRLKVGDDREGKRAYEFYADIAELNTVVNPNLNLLGKLADQNDYSRLAAMLNAAIDAGGSDVELVEIVDARMTAAINHALSVNMGLKKWAIESFRGDIDECLELLTKHAGELSANVLKDSAVELISATLSHFTAAEGHDGIYEALGLGGMVKEDESLLVWRERTSITRIPLTSHELGLPAEARLLDQNNFPAFYKACDAILSRTPDMPVAFRNRFIALTDGKVYELVTGYYNRSALILKRADFVVAK